MRFFPLTGYSNDSLSGGSETDPVHFIGLRYHTPRMSGQ